MFGRRNKSSGDDDNACPYCEFVNQENAESCSQCYYVFAASARDQPTAAPSTSGNELMSLLLSADLESPDEEEYAVEAILTLEDAAVEISQYETANEDDSFEFIGGAGPTLAQTIDYVKPEEVRLQVSDAPATPSNFELDEYDPLQDVPEPVHSGLGNLYSPMVKAETDDDLLGSVGPKSSVAMTPDIPDIPDMLPSKGGLASAMHQPRPTSKPIPAPLPAPIPKAIPAPIPKAIPAPIPKTIPAPIPKAIPKPSLPFAVSATVSTPSVQATTPELSVEEEKKEEVVEQVTEKPAPIPQMNGRIWPWPAKDAWSAAQVYREVVSALEQVKSGNLKDAAETLDNLGPHLSENLDMLLHIGIVMTYLGRKEHLQWTLAMAQRTYPNDEYVSSALARL
ncbi:hypothetical protein OAM96_03355 [Candidatus Poseidoniaceae archaeon]|nr:hypothetical protein [Candidatus Poseidoniaceae archaeon]